MIPAAQYLRMSTEQQQYSIANQSAVISEYANKCGFAVVKTYQDAGRSGLLLRNRAGLKTLLGDVVNSPSFRAILVYDVSRWGRFQDVDESAHYEFLCRSAGVPIHYCAEQFVNDGSLSSLVVKNLKRAMAAEFSRELGDKVLRGKQRLTALGFSVGGRAPYGFRRMLVGPDGTPKQILHFGESKNLTTDRVILVPGPAHETDTVKLIFKLVLEKGFRAESIARHLNQSQIAFVDMGPWSRENVDRLLRNPKYTGMNVWGRSTARLRTRSRGLSEDQWTTRAHAFPAVIDTETFDKVQLFLGAWRWTDDELLAGLREVWQKEGEITGEILCRVGYGPCYTTVLAHFGSLKKALDLIGYEPPNRTPRNLELRAASLALHSRVLKRIAKRFSRRVTIVKKLASYKRELLLDGRYRIAVLLANPESTSFRKTSWAVYPRPDEYSRPALCCLASNDYRKIVGVYGSAGVPPGRTKVAIKDDRPFLVKMRSLNSFCMTFSRIVHDSSS